MEQVVDQVRSSLLHLVTRDPDFFDAADVDYHIRSRDGLIRMFCKHHSMLHDGEFDVAAITSRLAKTMKWRKSVDVNASSVGVFPLELWTSKLWSAYEDNKYVIILYRVKEEKRISARWSDLMKRFILHVHNKYSLEAKHAGRKVIIISDARNISVSSIDIKSHNQILRLLDKNFPCLADAVCVSGSPLLTPAINLFAPFVLPPAVRKVFHVVTRDTITHLLPESHVPAECGGKLIMQNLLTFCNTEAKSVRDHYGDWGLEEWESNKVLQSFT